LKGNVKKKNTNKGPESRASKSDVSGRIEVREKSLETGKKRK